MAHEHEFVRYVERFEYVCDCGLVIHKEDLFEDPEYDRSTPATDEELRRFAERRESMGLQKYGTGEVLPEPDDEIVDTFSSEDRAELEQELRADEKPDDSN